MREDRREKLEALLAPCARFQVGAPVEPTPRGTYLGGTPFAPPETAWPTGPSGPLTFLGRFGLAADAWMPGDARWVSVFLNEAEGYVEPGEDEYCTIWLHESADCVPVPVPEGARTYEARAPSFTAGRSAPALSTDVRLGGTWLDEQGFSDDAAYETAAKELTGTTGGECQIGGYPTIYGGGELRTQTKAQYDLVLSLNRYPLHNGGLEMQIVDVLHVFYDRDEGRLIADMDR